MLWQREAEQEKVEKRRVNDENQLVLEKTNSRGETLN
jgi:hypothetical protein